MQPAARALWHRAPGYDSDEESEDEDSRLSPLVEERLAQISQVLSQREEGSPGLRADPAGPLPFMEFLPAPMPPSWTSSKPEDSDPEEPRAVPQAPYSQEPGFRIEHTDAPVVKETLISNGLYPTPENWLILWSGPRMPESIYQDLCEHQRVNHFPGSTELTRKDRLWLHFNGMAKLFGSAAFDFVPETFVLPNQLEEFIDAYERTDSLWIVKPNASSCGRGIFLLRSLDELPFDELLVVSRYVHNPMLIQGLKFDLRVYVLVTSYEPLRAYIYREGLTRFACLPYSIKDEHLQDAFRHLTNYSINKDSSEFVENKDFQADNVGHKWSLSALNKHLKCVGVDVKLMWARIMDLIVKSLLCVEPVIAARTRQTASHPTNCFELYGFDVLVDAELKPWLLEVNLSPSMQADSPLDWQIKSALLRDVLNLVGVPRVDRQVLMRHRLEHRMRRGQLAQGAGLRRSLSRKSAAGFPGSLSRDRRSMSVLSMPSMAEAAAHDRRPASGSLKMPNLADAFAAAPSAGGGESQQGLVLDNLTNAELRALVQSLQEHKRCHNFIRLHPTRSTTERYSQIASLRDMPAKPSQVDRPPSSRCSHLLAALLFGPPPIRCGLGAALASLSEQPAPQRPSAPQPAPLRLETLAPLRNTELPRAALARGGSGAAVAGDCSTAKELEEPALLPDAGACLGSPLLKADSFNGHSSFRRGLEIVKELGMREGCRVVLMDYLVRLSEACTSLSAGEATKMPQVVSARLSAFHKRVKRLSRSVRDPSPPKFPCEWEDSGLPHPRPADGRTLLEELAATCKACLSGLEYDAHAELGKPPAMPPVGRPLPAAVGGEDSSSTVARYLPVSLVQSGVGQRILALLPRLSALDLERILADPRCDPEFRTLIDPGETGHRQHSPSHRRRNANRSSCGRLEPRRVLWGPLSELVQSQAALNNTGEWPRSGLRAEERRGHSLHSEQGEETPSTSFERLTGSWARLAQRSDDAWRAFALPPPAPSKAAARGRPAPALELPGRRRHHAPSELLLEAVASSESPLHRLLTQRLSSSPTALWAQDIEL